MGALGLLNSHYEFEVFFGLDGMESTSNVEWALNNRDKLLTLTCKLGIGSRRMN